MTNQFEYIKQHYNVPAAIGCRVIMNGRAGVIKKDFGHYVGVAFDDSPKRIARCHPTWEMTYLEKAND